MANVVGPSQSDIRKALGQRIRIRRELRGWPSQRAFAVACRLDKSCIGEVERGETNISLGTILVIARKLKTQVADLFEGIA
jgi:transcriptional regulator with XRE-family HTH domain